MKAAVLFLCSVLLGASSARGAITAADRAAHPGMQAWEVDYEKPPEVKDMEIWLRYEFWDARVDGDVPSSRTLQAILLKKAPAHVAIKVFLGPRRSVIQINGREQVRGGGSPLDSSWITATKPKENCDGVYVLAQQPVDLKHPREMENVEDASAWIVLWIGLRP